MTPRLAVAWLERRLRDLWSGDPDDLDDFLAGNDAAIDARAQARRMASIVEAGGEVA